MTTEPQAVESAAAEQQRLIETHADFILLRRFDYSVEKALAKYPDGLPDNLVAQAMGKSVPWVQRRYAIIVGKLRAMVSG